MLNNMEVVEEIQLELEPSDRSPNRGRSKSKLETSFFPQRRREQRTSVRIRGLLYHGGNYQTTMIENVSIHGAGLLGATAIVPGDNVAIQLLNGRELSGQVIWWLAGRCGIAFHHQLEIDDQLFKRHNRNLA